MCGREFAGEVGAESAFACSGGTCVQYTVSGMLGGGVGFGKMDFAVPRMNMMDVVGAMFPHRMLLRCCG